MTFQQVFNQLHRQKKVVEYKSLSSDKVHEMYCTIPRKFQSESTKIIVWDLNEQNFHDIEVSSILSIR